MVVRVEQTTCSVCGLRLHAEPWFAGLCPRCVLGLALSGSGSARGDPVEVGQPVTPPPSSSSIAATDRPTAFYAEPGETPGESFTPGELLGRRYRIEFLLGRGGMGEVWRAYDLKLRLDVALKSLHPRLFSTAAGLELLRDEVRAAREVTSPNVCRLYDLVEVGERELVSMEYVDGVTLLGHLRKHGPLELKEANEIASQLLAGVEAIHQAGLVHRDIKPENVMLTRAGRVVVMDFGLTSPSGTGSLAGTPAYMAPEQARGEPVDARADVFSAGMVLAEMLSAAGGPEESSRQTFWEGVRQEPPVIPENPWTGILRQALSTEREARFRSAGELSRALEEVVFRVEGAEVEHPYPGLSSFREEDAEFFFGREAEIEAVWKKLQRTHLLGLIGPSGSGKSSFVNAGLLPAAPAGWSCLRLAPGEAPHAALGRALLPELEGDSQAMEALVALEDLASALAALRSWRSRHAQVLLIVDQFEELFTQSSADVQRRFADLLGRAAFDADVHVLLSMRDDFLFHCQAYEALRQLFSELTPLGPPTGAALRRAIVQPALRCGYRFEDESIVESMLEEVSRERGALPLIAFTAAQLWERRDRETGLLTEKAYEQIGGVGGALARHAEATLEQIGEANVSIVRELLRNLVTAQGTRASRDRQELLSVFSTPGAWSAGAEGLPPASSNEPVENRAVDGRWLYDVNRRRDSSVFRDGKVLLWDLSSLPGADPRVLKRSGRWFGLLDFHPTGDWFVAATENGTTLSFWPLKVPMPAVVSGYDTTATQAVAFTPDSRWLVTYWGQDRLRLWPLPGSGSREVRELESPRGNRTRLKIDAAGQRVFATGYGGNLAIVPLDGGEPRRLEGFEPSTWVHEGAFSPSGRLVAAATLGATEERVLRAWNLETGEARLFDLPQPKTASDGEGANGSGAAGRWVWQLAFTEESTLLTAGNAGVLRWDLEAGTHQPIVSSEPPRFADFRLSGDRRRLMTWVESECGSVELHDLATGQSRKLRTFADRLGSCLPAQVAVDETLSVLAVGRPDGTLQVGRLEGESAHLLSGHEGPVSELALSPDGRWLASSGQDKTLRLWPMPNLDQPPLHTLPRDELLAKLEALTNLRAVRDPESSTGWSIEIGPFPGWQEVPEW